MPEEDRRHIAVMFTDICSYTSLMGSDEDKAFDMLKRNHTIHATLINKHNGTLIKEVGDGTLASFPLASDAVRCAMDIQKEAKSQNIPLKCGVHQGEMVMVGADVIGDAVNVASRLQESAEEGCISISGAVYRDVKNKTGITTKFIGDKTLKGVDDLVKVYKVLCDEAEQIPVDDQPVKSKSRLLYYIMAGIIVVCAVIILWQLLPTKETIQTTPEVTVEEIDKSIAVLPFKNLSPDVDNQYFADGVAEGILNHLSKIKDLRVAGRTSTEKYRETTLQIPEIGEELKVTYLLEASVFKSEDKIRVTAQLINATNDEHLWSEQYDRELEDVFAVMSDISQEVASEVKVVILPEVKERIESLPTENLKAYDLYLKGKECEGRFWRSMNNKDKDCAINYYQKAIQLDSQFADAYVPLGNLIFYGSGTEMISPLDWSELAQPIIDTLLTYINIALGIDPNLAEAYFMLGMYYINVNIDYVKGIEMFEKAIDLNPNYYNATYRLGMNYFRKGDYIKSLKYFKKASDLVIGDPAYFNKFRQFGNIYHAICDDQRANDAYTEYAEYNSTQGYSSLCWFNASKGEWEKMKIYVDKRCSIDSSFTCWNQLGRYHMYNRNFNDAKLCFERYREAIKDRANHMTLRVRNNYDYAYTLYLLNQKNEATEIHNEYIEMCKMCFENNFNCPSGNGSLKFDLAGIYALLGDKEKAYQLLHEMENEVFHGDLVWYMQVDPHFESLREDEEFKQIIQRQEKKFADIRAEIDRLEQEGLL
ncbi:adenylate/guanylate cyclase domain-containing protein [Bacteroidota bacterium]